nr:uncharacterized protein LOC116155374 isoform X1 [Camelus dromedarius]
MDTALSTKPERSVYSEVTQRSLALPSSSSLKHEGYCSPLDFCLCSLDGLGQAGCEGLGAVVSRRQMILNEEYKRLDFLTVPGDGSGRKSRPPPPCKLGNSLAESVVLPGKWTLQEPLHGMFSLSTPGDYPTTFKIQIKQALNVKLSLSCVDRAHHPGLLEYDTPCPHVCCHPSVLLCVYIPMSSSRAEALSDSYLQPSCPTPVLNKCLMND